MENDKELGKLPEIDSETASTQEGTHGFAETIRETLKKVSKCVDEEAIKRFKELKPFKCADDIPDIPIVSERVYKDVVVPNLIRCGAIPKKDLVVGATYEGDTRNTDRAKWDGEKFVYTRYKWGFPYEDECNHFEDDDGYALFVPIKMIEEGTVNKEEKC